MVNVSTHLEKKLNNNDPDMNPRFSDLGFMSGSFLFIMPTKYKNNCALFSIFIYSRKPKTAIVANNATNYMVKRYVLENLIEHTQ